VAVDRHWKAIDVDRHLKTTPTSSLDAETTDRRAGCGKSASPVRREGRRRKWRRPYPYSVRPDAGWARALAPSGVLAGGRSLGLGRGGGGGRRDLRHGAVVRFRTA